MTSQQLTNPQANPLTKPLLRGHFHQAAFFICIGATPVLLSFCPNIRTFFAALVYCMSLTALFGISALYHRPTWNPAARKWMRRIDHAAIYILIAGTGTPVCLLGNPTENAQKLLMLFWFAALGGILQSLFWVQAPKWASVLFYALMIGIAFPYWDDIGRGIGSENLVLLFAGCMIYLLGAIIYARKKPNPKPKVFGYHEIFHLLVMVAASVHFLVVLRLIQLETISS